MKINPVTFIKNHKLDIFLVIFGVFLMYHSPIDPDFGWHYKYGEYMVQNKRILRENIFSYTFPDYEWANSYWISQVIFYLICEVVTPRGLSFVVGFFLSLFIVFILNKAKVNSTGKIFGSIVAFIILSAFWATIRPFYFSCIFFILLTYVLFLKPEKEKYLPIMFLLWANMHADFTIGLFIYGVYTANKILSHYKEKNLNELPKKLIAPIASVLVTLINPYGFGLWETLFKETNPYQFKHVGEWTPMKLAFDEELQYKVGLVAIMAISVSAFEKIKENYMWFFIPFGFLFAFSIRSQYFIRILPLITLFPVSIFWGDLLADFSKVFDAKQNRKMKLAITTCAGTLLFATVFITVKELTLSEAEMWEKYNFPYEAVQYIKENPIEGKMFNNYNWGGFLIWQLPEYKTFVDGRMPSWRENGVSVFEEYMENRGNEEKRKDMQEEYSFKWALNTQEETKRSHWNTNYWEKVFESENTTILSKKVTAN